MYLFFPKARSSILIILSKQKRQMSYIIWLRQNQTRQKTSIKFAWHKDVNVWMTMTLSFPTRLSPVVVTAPALPGLGILPCLTRVWSERERQHIMAILWGVTEWTKRRSGGCSFKRRGMRASLGKSFGNVWQCFGQVELGLWGQGENLSSKE